LARADLPLGEPAGARVVNHVIIVAQSLKPLNHEVHPPILRFVELGLVLRIDLVEDSALSSAVLLVQVLYDGTHSSERDPGAVGDRRASAAGLTRSRWSRARRSASRGYAARSPGYECLGWPGRPPPVGQVGTPGWPGTNVW
jgi:hypothetical protein